MMVCHNHHSFVYFSLPGGEVQSADRRDPGEPSRGEACHLHGGGHRETEAAEGGARQSQPDTERTDTPLAVPLLSTRQLQGPRTCEQKLVLCCVEEEVKSTVVSLS